MVKLIKVGLSLDTNDKKYQITNKYQSRTPRQCQCNC